MKCPNCKSREFNIFEARGFTSKESPLKECDCGHLWRVVPLPAGGTRIDVIKQGENINVEE